ncbi:MAG: hypothetical protein UW55_C0024G0008 [Candidatus Giovannonibacteria bacterium GW2011_GWA2_44_26]|uniref:Uncharacterized protein n=1 Tax=Candidatus Giovannonibacteria bacterium GW2011_GWA2_44_26 TaxID=1618648 RepID=A0A0G1IQV5_9BACT|nr:MAG: hypothetical protein UW55_C0024G0008 [Candidatus Giovannonibacteria bacterium GW2011_GWA2_44_26]
MKKKLAQGAIGTGAGTLAYTVPTGYKTRVTDIGISNTTSGALSVKLYFVPSGGSVVAANLFLPDSSIAGNGMLQLAGEQILNAGDYIQAIGSGSGLTMNISGEEYR